MIKIIPVIFIGLFLFGCSAQKETVKERTHKSKYSRVPEDSKKRALDHFVNGTLAESRGDYARAILEFQDALRYDTSSGIFYALSKSYSNLNKLSLALQNIKEAIRMDSSRIEYYELLAAIYSSAHQFDSSAAALNKILQMDSLNVNAYYNLARLHESQRPSQAIAIYEKLTKLIGADWSVLTRTAELYDKLGERAKAAEVISELLTLNPSSVQLQKLLIEYYQRAELFEEALNVAEEILSFNPEDIDARERKAQLLLQMDKWDLAADEYAFILNQAEVPLEIKIRIGAAYFAESFRDSTLLPLSKDFFTKIDRDTSDWQVKMYLGAIAINENEDSTAIGYFRDVTEMAKWNVEAWIRLGGLYFDNRKYEESARVMSEAIESFPEDFVVNLILGLSLAQSNNHSGAKDYLKKAVELNPKDITAVSAFGFTLNQLKESGEAVKYLIMALKIEPDNVNLLGTLGMIYNSMEEWAKSDSLFELALQIDSLNPTINNNYAYYLSERDEQLERALQMAEIAVEAEPLNSSFLDTIGWVYYKLGNYPLAKEFIQKSIDAGSASAVVYEHLGDVNFMLGDIDNAKLYWNKAFDLDQENDKLKTKIETGKI
jgi:tetratricopeptide (TPR) repeat protein